MEVIKNKIDAFAIKFTIDIEGQTVGRVYLYILSNDLHKQPFGLVEDLFVDESFRSQGLGRQLIDAVINEAKIQGCYKLIGTSRHTRSEVHEWYKRLGFSDYGLEFRMDL